jgi:hypothetical protein
LYYHEEHKQYRNALVITIECMTEELSGVL